MVIKINLRRYQTFFYTILIKKMKKENYRNTIVKKTYNFTHQSKTQITKI